LPTTFPSLIKSQFMRIFRRGSRAGNRSTVQPYTLLLASWLAVLGLTVIRNQLTNSAGYYSKLGINISLITPTKCTIFIYYIHLLCFSYMFRCTTLHQGELTCPLLKTTCCYATIVYG